MPLLIPPEELPEPLSPDPTPLVPDPGVRPDGGFEGALVDLSQESVLTLLTQVSGREWVCTYYRQLLAAQSEPTPFQKTQEPVYQQYEVIERYPLRVISPLTGQVQSESEEFVVQGEAIVPLAIVPNYGDCFVADIGDGRTGLFTLHEVIRKTMLRESCYEIAYALLDYATEEIQALLDERVVRTLYYNPAFLGSKRGPLLSGEEETIYYQAKQAWQGLDERFYSTYFDEQTGTLLVPGEGRTYDPMAVTAYLAISEVGLRPLPRVIPVDGAPHFQNTLWPDLLAGEKCPWRIGYPCYQELPARRFYYKLLYSGVPMEALERVILPAQQGENLYLFSAAFYAGNYVQMSLLEQLTDDYLVGKPMDWGKLTLVLHQLSPEASRAGFYQTLVTLILLRHGLICY